MDILNYNYLLNRFTTNQSTIEVYVYTEIYISNFFDTQTYDVLVDHTWEVVVNHNDGQWIESHEVGNVTDRPVYLPSNVIVDVNHEGQMIKLNLPELVVDFRSWDYSIDFEIFDDQIDLYIYDYDDVEISSAAVMIGGDEQNAQYLTIPYATRKDAALSYFYEDIEPLWEQYDYNNGYQVGEQEGYHHGYNIGEQRGIEEGYNNGYHVGEQEGYNNGYNVGYNVGYNDGEINRPLTTFGTVIKVISDNASNLLNTEILPNFTISNIIFIPVIFSLLGIVFKFFRR